MTRFGTFFVPGPTEVRHDVLAAMLQPMIPHRSAAFEAIFERTQRGLKHVFRTTRPVYVSASSGSGMMEAAIRNAPAGPILCLVNGAFSDRFASIARACDREVVVLQAEWGAVHDLDAVDRALSSGRFAAMTATHSETSTGALSDVAALAKIAHTHGAMILVDSVSGLGGAPLETDA
ncbi:MAG: alanine--glyoxylate aminotransferase family protein [Gemmatimonadetes bacterium]|nr:alanine--glyoxylate aminotransferase family protein [Gemmatimonadota bacterium]